MNVWEDNEYQQTRMKKILIVQCIDVNFSQQFSVQLPYDYQNRQLDLGLPLHHILQQTLDLKQQHQIFYFHPVNNHYVYAGLYPIKHPLILGEDFIQQDQITIRIRMLGSENQDFVVVSKEEKECHEKKKRVTQRSIRQILQKVSEWRQINQKNPKITLDEAAKIVGVPKKTLDDYYGQIKIASQHKFDFQSNLDEKIGTLRKFVRQNHTKKKNYSELQFLDNILKKDQHSDDQEQQQEE